MNKEKLKEFLFELFSKTDLEVKSVEADLNEEDSSLDIAISLGFGLTVIEDD